ncbi:hypothetical protein [Yinghuangia soli]|uniref:Secreted protein n=1 Tax=Yinghuangia soli TaxID=2908204 RepID=A0AA41PWY8_9ACTN|nr:hypothetical protein [Yinghuangia soli]MCF2527253.1 hypothetical protein [Yinghuangia soli]
MTRRTRLKALAAAILLGCTAITASTTGPANARPAAAAPSPHKLYSGIFKQARYGELLTTVASCPQGEFATGGGSFNYDYDDPAAFTVGSYGGSNFWVTQAHNLLGPDRSISVISYVVCSPAPHTVLMEPEGGGVDVPPGEVRSHIARCPSGQVPTGGGPRTSSGRMLINDSIPFTDGWAATAKNVDAQPGRLWVNVTCSTVPHAVHFGPDAEIAPGTSGSSTVICPRGQFLTGGGVQTSDDFAYVRDTLPSADAEQNVRLWTTRAVNVGSTPQTVTAWGICTTP